jgi:hypothetical protein
MMEILSTWGILNYIVCRLIHSQKKEKCAKYVFAGLWSRPAFGSRKSGHYKNQVRKCM